jgi:hypothetical protein
MLQCKKLMSLGLSERKEVLEKSGLCTFCLKHAAELECYGRGGMSKPRCTQSGCDGEHTPSVHKLMGEEHAGVNLVAEDESDTEGGESEDEDEYQDHDKGEGWWVAKKGMMEVSDREEETLEEVVESEFEYSPDDYFADKVAEDGWRSPGSIQPYSAGDETGAQLPPARRLPYNKSTAIPGGPHMIMDGPHMKQSPCSTGTKRRRLRKRSKNTIDQDWEEARRSAWLRQMLSDTSSNEDEEQYGRFAEPGRWMAELFEIPQHLAATSGGECSGQKKPEYS